MALDVSIEDENGNYVSHEMHGGVALGYAGSFGAGLGIGAFVVTAQEDDWFELESEAGEGTSTFKSATKVRP